MVKQNKKTNVSYEKYQKKRVVEKGRAEGDKWIYYILHSFYAALIFIVVAIYFDYFILKSDFVTDIFTISFLQSIGIVFIVSIAINLFSRVLAYKTLQGIYRKSVTRNFWQLNSTGVNKVGVRYLLAILISSALFCLGAVMILQEKLFSQKDEVTSIILIYISIKVFIFIMTKLLVEVRG